MLLSHTTFPSQAMEPAAHLLGSSIEHGGFAKTTRDAHSSQPSALPPDTQTGSVPPRAQPPPHAGAITTTAGQQPGTSGIARTDKRPQHHQQRTYRCCRKDVTCLKTHFSADKGCTRKGDCTSRKALCFIFIMHSKKIKIQKIDFRASLSQPSGMLSRYVALTPPFVHCPLHSQ